MSDLIGDDVLAIADRIVSYLATHQHSADTLEGIVKWWLLRQRLEEETAKVQRAVDKLCEDGVLKGISVQGGSTVYMMNGDSQERT